MKIALLTSPFGPCADCNRTARYGLSIGLLKDLRLCPRCAAYLATTLISRIDDARHGPEMASAAGAALARISSPAKAAAARENGKRGGRPRRP